jgi:hypothetical protein
MEVQKLFETIPNVYKAALCKLDPHFTPTVKQQAINCEFGNNDASDGTN